MDDSRRKLMWHGMFLFLLGLLTGFAQQKFVNPRMGLAAHLEGVMNGIFLLALSAIWGSVGLAGRSKAAAYWIVLYGTYVNWATTALAACFGAAALAPIASVGYSVQPWQEKLTTALFMSVGVAMVAASVMVLAGLRKKAAGKTAPV